MPRTGTSVDLGVQRRVQREGHCLYLSDPPLPPPHWATQPLPFWVNFGTFWVNSFSCSADSRAAPRHSFLTLLDVRGDLFFPREGNYVRYLYSRAK